MKEGERIVRMIDTIWGLNKYKVIEDIAKTSGCDVPRDCYGLIETAFKFGALHMEMANGKNWRKKYEHG